MSRLPESTGRRVALVLILVAAVLVVGVSYVRIADVHAQPGWSTLETDRDPTALVDDIRAELRRVDHRTVTRVSRVDPETGEPTPVLVHEDAYDYSDAQYVANYAAVGEGSEAAWAQHHSLIAQLGGEYVRDDDGRTRVLLYADDRTSSFLVGRGVSSEIVGAYRLENREVVGGRRAESSIAVAYQFPFFLDRPADWQVADRTGSTLTLVIDDPDQYLAVRRLFGISDVHEGTRIELVVDRETGQPLSVSERRVLSYERETENGSTVTRRRTFRLETTVSDVGSVDVERPPGTFDPTLAGLVQDFLRY